MLLCFAKNDSTLLWAPLKVYSVACWTKKVLRWDNLHQDWGGEQCFFLTIWKKIDISHLFRKFLEQSRAEHRPWSHLFLHFSIVEKEQSLTVAGGSWWRLTDGSNLSAPWLLRGPHVPDRFLQMYSLIPSDGFSAQSRDSHIDSVPFFNPLTSLYQASQEACGYLISLSYKRIGKQLPNFAIIIALSPCHCGPLWHSHSFFYFIPHSSHTCEVISFYYCSLRGSKWLLYACSLLS